MIWPVSAESKGEKAVGASGHPFGEVSAHPSEVKAKVTQLCPNLCNATDYIVEYINKIDKLLARLIKKKEKLKVSQSGSLQPYGLYSPWDSPSQNTGMGSLLFLQGIVPTQESNCGLLYCRQIFFFFFTN